MKWTPLNWGPGTINWSDMFIDRSYFVSHEEVDIVLVRADILPAVELGSLHTC